MSLVQVSKEIASEKKATTLLAVVGSVRYEEVVASLLNYLLKRDKKGIYINISVPYDELIIQFAHYGIDMKKIFIIDTITPIETGRARLKNCLFTGSPKYLTEVSIALTQIIQQSPEMGFFMVDSLTNLIKNHTEETIQKFINFLHTASQELNMEGVLLIEDTKENSKFVKNWSKLVEKVVYVS